MNIYEAMKARTADKPFLTRRKWIEDWGPLAIYGVRVLPTGSPDGCMLLCRMIGTSKPPAPRWQPVADDLRAEDWEVTD